MSQEGNLINNVAGVYEFAGKWTPHQSRVSKFQIRQSKETIYIKNISLEAPDWGEAEAVFDFEIKDPENPKVVMTRLYKQTVAVFSSGPYVPNSPIHYAIGNPFFTNGQTAKNWYADYIKAQERAVKEFKDSVPYPTDEVVKSPKVASDGVLVGLMISVPGWIYIRTQLL
jgi:hypothetical protein